MGLVSSWSCKWPSSSWNLGGRDGKHESRTNADKTLTSNIGLFGWILKIRRLPILGLEFEAESQKWPNASEENTHKHKKL